MSPRVLLLILCSVFLSAGAQIFFKFGMKHVTARVTAGSHHATLLLALMNPLVLAGFVAYGASALIWLFVLQRTSVSLAYPFVGLGIVLTATAAWLFVGETLRPTQIVGILLVCAGVALVGAVKY
jgi:drug/metabolite transporter (DMT)-like permease